ncbi:Panacea domain-containing protein [Bartonella sp. DGB2]|uniref:Panacea domain-containing protein n=2 Tax=Bartonella sp. DGB2 TaxID=3388426 RepID=UPI00398FDBF3
MESVKTYDSRTVAYKFLDLKEKEDGGSLTLTQVLKLVYIAHGWMLGIYHHPLIKDPVQAWTYGPVIPNLYEAIRRFGKSTVKKAALKTDETLNTEAIKIIEWVYKHYGHLSDYKLSDITHAKGTPWEQTYTGEFGTPISDKLIETYYRGLWCEAK